MESIPAGTSIYGGSNTAALNLPARRYRRELDNDPPSKDVKTVFEWAYKGIGNDEFGPLLQLILDAEKQ
jgi:hypothetical protein